MISNYVGAENAYEKGTSMRSSVKNVGKKAKEKAGAFAKKAARAKATLSYYRDQREAGATKREVFGSMTKDLISTIKSGSIKGVLGVDSKDLKEEYDKTRKERTDKLELSAQTQGLIEILERMNSRTLSKDDAFKKAKDLGIEDKLADELVQKINTKAIIEAKRNGTTADLKLLTGKGMLEEIKAAKEFKDGVTEFNNVVKSMSIKFQEMQTFSAVGIDVAESLRRAQTLDTYTDEEIRNETNEDTRAGMRQFNALISEYKEAEGEMKSIANTIRTSGIAAAKFKTPDLQNSVLQADFKNAEIAKETMISMVQTAISDAKGTGPVTVQYKDESRDLDAGITKLQNAMTDSIEKVAKDIAKSGKKSS